MKVREKEKHEGITNWLKKFQIFFCISGKKSLETEENVEISEKKAEFFQIIKSTVDISIVWSMWYYHDVSDGIICLWIDIIAK